MADAEGQAPDQFAAEAIAFYVRLPTAARRSLRAMATLGGDGAMDAVAHAAGHAIVQVGMDVARERGRRAAARAYPDRNPTSEADVDRKAFRLSQEASSATGSVLHGHRKS